MGTRRVIENVRNTIVLYDFLDRTEGVSGKFSEKTFKMESEIEVVSVI